MAVYDTSLVYCAESDVFATSLFTWTSDSEPTDTQVYGFAKSAAAEVVQATRRAGAATLPPASGIADSFTAQHLVHANAVGAAYYAWRAAARSGDQYAVDMRDRLREEWVQYVGGMNAAGHQVEGSIVTTLQAVNDVLVLHGDELDGRSAFPSGESTETLDRRFSVHDVD